tara:strand:+ start:231 stop:455 length:225 start_codon:yes stop_codon:yes gene_type:complete
MKEKKIVNKIGEKIKTPKPGANNNPNDAVRICGTLEERKKDEKWLIMFVVESLCVPAKSITSVDDGIHLERNTK